MKHVPFITTADILHKIENIEKEVMDFKIPWVHSPHYSNLAQQIHRQSPLFSDSLSYIKTLYPAIQPYFVCWSRIADLWPSLWTSQNSQQRPHNPHRFSGWQGLKNGSIVILSISINAIEFLLSSARSEAGESKFTVCFIVIVFGWSTDWVRKPICWICCVDNSYPRYGSRVGW